MTEPILTETITDSFGTFKQRWMCEPPPEGTKFRALDDVWDEDDAIRTIYRIEVENG